MLARLPALLLLAVTSCVTVTPGALAVVVGRGEPPAVVGEGTRFVSPTSVVEVVDLRARESDDRLLAVTADGAAVEVATSVVTWRLDGGGLPELVRQIGPDIYAVAISPVVSGVTRRVLGQLRLDQFDGVHLEVAERTITATCAEVLRPLHVAVDLVELRGVRPLSPEVRASIEAAATAEQQVLGIPNQLQLARARATQALEVARGVAAANRALDATLDPVMLAELRTRALTQLLDSKNTEVVLDAPVTLEASP
jgi:hypothetical protein